MNNIFFPTIILTYLEAFRQVFSKPNYDYFKSFIWASLLVKGRKCITNIHNASFFLEKHFSSFERFFSQNKWDINKVIKTAVEIIINQLKDRLKIHGGFLAVLDTTKKAKSGKGMLGIQKWSEHSSNPDRGDHIVGHHWSILGLICNCFERYFCFPVLTRLISGNKNPFQYLSNTFGVVKAGFFDISISMVLQLKELLPDEVLRVVADAYYGKAVFIQPLIDKGVEVITKLRRDAVGWEKPVQSKGRGRPRKYGKKWKLADLLKLPEAKDVLVKIYGKKNVVKAVYKDLFLRGINKIVRIVVVEGVSSPVILVSTDLSLCMENIIEIYSSRFSIEIAIRDLKQYFGFGDYQFTTTLSIFRFVQLCCISFCLWRLVSLSENDVDWLSETDNITMTETKFSFSRIGRSLRMFVIKKILFSNSAVNTEVEKIIEKYKNIFKVVS